MPPPGPSKGDLVTKFVTYFYQHIRNASVPDIQTMYMTTFKKISDDYFKTSPWPYYTELKHHVNDELFWILYQEMYYRHLHGLRQSDIITLEHRRESWKNYVRLFEILQTQNTKMNLPNVWLWDMIDEFLYQFGLYTSIKGLVSERTNAEIEFLKANQDVWDPAKVQAILESFIQKSDIRTALGADGGQKLFETDVISTSESNVLPVLGYFSLVGLSRYLCLLGQYEDSLKALAPLNPFNKQFLYTLKVPMANISLYYYAGTSYLMLRRYIDAGRCFSSVLSFIDRVKKSYQNTAFHELMLKKNEQIYKLLALCIAMCVSVERWLDDAVKENLRKKAADDLLQMQSGSMEHFKKVFSYGCPKFVTAMPPDLSEAREDNSLAGFHAARQRFMAEAEATHQLPDLKRSLKLYTSISTTKLAELLKCDVSTLMAALHSMQQRATQKQWSAGDAASGQEAAVTEIDFSIEKDKASGEDVVVVRENPIPANHLATLAKHILRFEQITLDMDRHTSNAPVAVVASAAAAR